MGTKADPGKFDCYANALPGEPMFVLLARDPMFAELVRIWSDRRARDIACGERPLSDAAMVTEARECADAGEQWRRKNYGAWRSTVTFTDCKFRGR